jgi:hypothetical protein
LGIIELSRTALLKSAEEALFIESITLEFKNVAFHYQKVYRWTSGAKSKPLAIGESLLSLTVTDGISFNCKNGLPDFALRVTEVIKIVLEVKTWQ